jgi:hypothetical protein
VSGRTQLLLLLLLFAPVRVFAWSARAHRLVTDLAVDLVPAPCAEQFRTARAELMQHSVEPDTVLRDRDGQREAVRHFIDLDAYMPYPFSGFPRTYREAVARYDRRTVNARGVVPWVILRLRHQLREELRAHDRDAIVRDAGYLSHYVADVHQPLHLTVNYDGQRTGNDGVHLRLELGLVDDRIESYEAALRGHLPNAARLRDVRSEIFTDFVTTYPLVDIIMQADRAAAGSLWRYSPFYYRRMDAALHNTIERQLGRAAVLLASIWTTACAEAHDAP